MGIMGMRYVIKGDRHIVFFDKKLCTCRAWDVTGIPCSHAIRAMDHANIDPLSHITSGMLIILFNLFINKR